jgi:hypothetical protein
LQPFPVVTLTRCSTERELDEPHIDNLNKEGQYPQEGENMSEAVMTTVEVTTTARDKEATEKGEEGLAKQLPDVENINAATDTPPDDPVVTRHKDEVHGTPQVANEPQKSKQGEVPAQHDVEKDSATQVGFRDV